MRGLYSKIMLLVGGVFAVTVLGILGLVYVTESREIEQEGLVMAETLNRMVFEALYTSMRQGGGRAGNQEVIARLQKDDAFTTLRVVKGEPVIRQFGVYPDELPQNELERRALAGEEVREVHWVDGYPVVRYATPLRVRPACQRCHRAEIGDINGAIFTEISLQEYGKTLRQRRNSLLSVVGGSLLALGLLVFYTVRRIVILPLRTIQEGIAIIAESDLEHQLDVHTGDELEELASEFNRMVHQLGDTYREIVEERSKVVAAIESSRDAIWITDASHRVVMVNSALERLTEQGREELLQRSCSDLMGMYACAGASICDVACPLSSANKRHGVIEGRILTPSGKEAWVEIGYGRVADPDGHLGGVLYIVHDLTEHKEVEKLKDEFVSMVSHELRTPLHHIKGFATTLLQTDVVWDAATQRDFLESINHEADRLANLVDKTLHLSRLTSNGLPINREWCSVNDLIDSTLTRRRTLDADQRVELQIPPDLPPLFVDCDEIETVLANLIENALKYSDPPLPVRLEVEVGHGLVTFCIADQGIGIAPEYRQSIFDRFFRVNGQVKNISGSGLGLAICKRIVEAHKGRIWVESTQGVGSRFYFCLPIHAPNAIEEGYEEDTRIGC